MDYNMANTDEHSQSAPGAQDPLSMAALKNSLPEINGTFAGMMRINQTSTRTMDIEDLNSTHEILLQTLPSSSIQHLRPPKTQA